MAEEDKNKTDKAGDKGAPAPDASKEGAAKEGATTDELTTLTSENETLTSENETLKADKETLEKKVKELEGKLEKSKKGGRKKGEKRFIVIDSFRSNVAADKGKVYDIEDDVSDFDAERLKDLVDRGLVREI